MHQDGAEGICNMEYSAHLKSSGITQQYTVTKVDSCNLPDPGSLNAVEYIMRRHYFCNVSRV